MAKIKNTARKPKEGTITRSVRFSKGLDAAVKEIAEIRRISVADAYRILVEKGIQCRQDGTFGQQLTSILGNMKYKTERNELILKLLLEMLRKSDVIQQCMWNIMLDITAGRQADFENSMIKAKIYSQEEINEVMKGEDNPSAAILNDMLASELA